MHNTIIRTCVAMCLLFTIVGCGSSTSSSGFSYSSSQSQYIDARGNPEQFTIMFARNELGDDGLLDDLSSPRRIETWMYRSATGSYILFDSQFFVSESFFADRTADLLDSTELRPSQFTHDMTQDDVIELLGEADSTDTGTIAGQSITVLRWNAATDKPVKSVAFAGSQLVAVVAGYGFDDV